MTIRLHLIGDAKVIVFSNTIMIPNKINMPLSLNEVNICAVVYVESDAVTLESFIVDYMTNICYVLGY